MIRLSDPDQEWRTHCRALIEFAWQAWGLGGTYICRPLPERVGAALGCGIPGNDNRRT